MRVPLLFLCLVPVPAQDTTPTSRPTRIEKVTVEGREGSLIGTAASAGEGVVSGLELGRRPLLRPGEVLETVPGLIATQHSGAGKANQFFLRGFNLDHGTDLRTTFLGLPMNLPSHGHGQGYTDLQLVIPELIESVSFRKGPYQARDGDFGSAGSADIEYRRRLDEGLVRFEAGSFRHARSLVAGSVAAGQGDLLLGVELMHRDGPWVNPDDYDRWNGVVRWTTGDEREGLTLSLLGYDASWTATDQVAARAVEQGKITRFGTLDETSGGETSRYALLADWHAQDERSATRATAYASYYDLDLFSNFTYALADPMNGDQFEQTDHRLVLGFDLSRTWYGSLLEGETESTLGLQLRHDAIDNGLFSTSARRRLATTRRDEIGETALAAWVENRARWSPWLRTTLGLRGDAYRFEVDSDLPANSGTDWTGLLSPRGAIVLGPWASTELYLNGGLGFHSNDARGVLLRDDPTTSTPDDGTPVPGLVRTRGAEVGLRTTVLPGLQSTLSAWLLDSDSELVFVGDAGNTEPSRASRRQGLEWANDYELAPGLTFDLDLALSRARFTEDAPEGDHVPNAVETVLASGLSWRSQGGLEAALRVRHFGPRDLIEDGSVRSSSTTLWTARLGYAFNEQASLTLDVFNLFDAEGNDIEYYYSSRLPGEPPGPDGGGYNDIHFHPVEPLSLQIAFTARF
jgi:hypothetical protein